MDKKALIKALRDTAQSTSNSVAEAVSAPIDAITWALRKSGMNIEKPVMGSEWMAEKGLTTPVEPGYPKMAGEVLGNVIPAIGFAKAPQIAAGMNRMVDNAMAPAKLRKESGMFIGPSAKTWDADAARQAQTMAAKGADPRKIWSETGTFKGPDGKWRQEIPDNAAAFNRSNVSDPAQFADVFDEAASRSNGVPMGNALDHSPLYKAYPEQTATRFKVEGAGPSMSGSYDERARMVSISDPYSSKIGADTPESVALHELQHAIQTKEGWAKGGAPKQFESDISALNELNNMGFSEMDDFQRSMFKDLREKYGKSRSPNEVYQRLAGEAEARATQARTPLTAAQRRAKFPLDSYDVPIESLIVRGAQ